MKLPAHTQAAPLGLGLVELTRKIAEDPRWEGGFRTSSTVATGMNKGGTERFVWFAGLAAALLVFVCERYRTYPPEEPEEEKEAKAEAEALARPGTEGTGAEGNHTDSAAPQKSLGLVGAAAKVTFLGVVWCCFSAGLTVYNKWIFMEDGGNFPFTIFVTWWHQLLATIFTRTLWCYRPDYFPAVQRGEVTSRIFLTGLLPPGLCLSGALYLGNRAYLFLSVAYIQMIKSVMPVAVFSLSCAIGTESPGLVDVGTMLAATVGAIVCTTGETQWSSMGFAFMMGSFASEAIRLVMVKRFLSGERVSLDALSGLYYYSPVCLVALTVLLQALELSQVTPLKVWDLSHHLLANGAVAIGLNVSSLVFMKAASATLFTLYGLLKDLTLILGSAVLLHGILTTQQIIAYVVIVISVRTFQKNREKTK